MQVQCPHPSSRLLVFGPDEILAPMKDSVPFATPRFKPNSSCRVDTDHEELFRQESYFAYLTGVVDPDCWATIELPSGRSTLFIPRLDAECATASLLRRLFVTISPGTLCGWAS